MTTDSREHEARWQLALASADEGVWDWDLGSGALFRSPTWLAMLGYAEHELAATYDAWQERVHPEDRPRFEAALAEHVHGKCDALRLEYRMARRDTTWRWIACRGQIVARDADNRPLRIVGTHVDVTEQREAADQQRALLARLHMAVKTSGTGIFEVDFTNGSRFLYNQEMHDIYEMEPGGSWFREGVPPETFGGTMNDWIETIIPEDRPKILAMIESIDHDKGVLTYDYRTRLPSGRLLHLSSCAHILRDASGRPTGTIGTTVDVTEQRELTAALANDRDRLELATRVSGFGVWELDLKTGKVEWDARMHELFGVTPAEFDGTFDAAVQCVHPDDRRDALRAWDNAGAARTLFDAEFRVVHPRTGDVRHIRTLGRSMRQEGQTRSAIGINWDVTDERRASEILLRAKEAAEAGERAKSEFMASISHEIRTPMNGLLGMLELLLDSVLTEAQREMVDVMQKSGQSLLVIIDDILDYSKLEAGKMRLREEPFDLREAVDATIALLAVQARRKDLQLLCHVDPGVETHLVGDAERVKQVINNLVGNAIKFTDRGSITVRVLPMAPRDTRCAIRFEVRDTGVGIPVSMHAQLFKPFKQVDQSDRRRFGGSGLGLTISREIALAMGGSIRFESHEGQGSTFWFDVVLPRERERSPVPQDETPDLGVRSVRYRPLRILLVEDNEANQRVGVLLLEQLGHRVTVAADGSTAIGLVAARDFDCVLMDCQMPELDGYQTARRIRDERGRNAAVPIIAITAAGMPGDRERCLAAGMNEYILKPFRRAELARAFACCGMALGELAPQPSRFDIPARMQLDREHLAQLRQVVLPNGENLLESVIGLVLQEMPERVLMLERLVRADDAHAAAQLAHKMAGSCGCFGALAMRDELNALETSARAGGELTRTVAHIAECWHVLVPQLVALLEHESSPRNA